MGLESLYFIIEAFRSWTKTDRKLWNRNLWMIFRHELQLLQLLLIELTNYDWEVQAEIETNITDIYCDRTEVWKSGFLNCLLMVLFSTAHINTSCSVLKMRRDAPLSRCRRIQLPDFTFWSSRQLCLPSLWRRFYPPPLRGAEIDTPVGSSSDILSCLKPPTFLNCRLLSFFYLRTE